MVARTTVPAADGRRHSGSLQLAWVGWARLVAIVAVLAIHSTTHLVLGWGTTSALSWHFGNLLQSASRWCVPLFVMVSGALLLRGRPGDTAVGFWRRRIARIGVPLVVWTLFYLWFDATQTGEPFTPYYLVQGFAWGTPYYHLYFLYVIAGLYLITPFLRTFVAAASPRLLAAATAVVLCLASVDYLQHWWMGGGGQNAVSYFVPWIGYYLLGLLLAEVDLHGRRRTVAYGSAVSFVLTVLVTALVTWGLFGRLGAQQGRLLYDYFFPLTVVAAAAVLLFLRAVTDPDPRSEPGVDSGAPSPLQRWANRLAGLSFGVYLLHPLPLQLFVRRDQPSFQAPWMEVCFHLAVIVTLLVGCGLVVAVVRQVPVLRRLV